MSTIRRSNHALTQDFLGSRRRTACWPPRGHSRGDAGQPNASGWPSSPPSGDFTRTPGTWASGFWSAIRSTGIGIIRRFDVVSVYVDQTPENDLSRQRSAEFGFPIYPTIAETVCCGGDKLAVDAVLIIGEHGNYPKSEIGQTKYPRYEFFKQTTDVFRQDGRAVPVFNDKHLSWNWDWAEEMVAISRESRISRFWPVRRCR